MPHTTSPHPDDVANVVAMLTSEDPPVIQLAKEIALFAYNEERKLTDAIENRAFGLMQFAKVGLTIVAGIAGLISNAGIQDVPFRESLILLLAIASAYLGKLFYRGSRVVRVGTIFEPHSDFHVKPDESDVYAAARSAESYLQILKTHVSNLVLYFEHTAGDNEKRIYQCKCCFINTTGFLVAFFLFFALSLMHLFEPKFTMVLPEHRIVGFCLFALALITDQLIELSSTKWLRKGRS